MDDAATTPSASSGLGEMLRRAREAQGLTPADLARQMNLDLRLIAALEAEDLASLPAPVYVRGYLRRLAATLNLDEGALLEAHQRLAGSIEPAPLRSSPPIETMKSAHEGGRRRPWLAVGLAIGLVVLGFWGSSLISSAWLDKTPSVEPEPPAAPPAVTPLPLPLTPEPPPPAPPASATPAPPAPVVGEIVSPPPPAPVAEPAPAVGLELRAGKGESWVQVKDATGKVLFEGVLKAGSMRQVDGARPFQVVIGRAEAISLSLDGKAVDLAAHTRPNGKAFIARLGG